MIETLNLAHDSQRHEKTLAEFIDELRAAHPGAATELRNHALAELSRHHIVDDGWRRVMHQLFTDALRIHIVEQPKKRRASSPQEREHKIQIKQALVEKITQRHDALVEAEVAIRLLEYQTTYGKPLGDCTGAECQRLSRRYGVFFSEVAKRLNPSDHVRQHMTEVELQAIAKSCRLIGGQADR